MLILAMVATRPQLIIISDASSVLVAVVTLVSVSRLRQASHVLRGERIT